MGVTDFKIWLANPQLLSLAHSRSSRQQGKQAYKSGKSAEQWISREENGKTNIRKGGGREIMDQIGDRD